MISFASVKIKSKKSFFNFDENDENESFDDDELNANKNNLFDNINKNENETDSAKNSQKKENAITKIVDEKLTKFDLKNNWKEFFNF